MNANCPQCHGSGTIRVDVDGEQSFASLRYSDKLIDCPSCKPRLEGDAPEATDVRGLAGPNDPKGGPVGLS
jgi:hypothetical protein